MRTVLVCLLVVASATALDKPASPQVQVQEKQASYPEPGTAAPPQQQPAGFPAPGTATLPQSQGAAFPEATLLNQAQQPAANPKNVFINQQLADAVISSTAAPSSEGLPSETLERIEQKSNIVEQTSNHIDERIEIPIPTPYAVTYENKIPFNKPSPAPASRAVQLQGPQAYPTQLPEAYSAQVPQAYSAQLPQSGPFSLPYAFPQQYAFPRQLAFSPQTYSFAAPQLQVPSAPLFSQYNFANSQQYSLPNAAPLQPRTQLKTASPPPPLLVKAPQPSPLLKAETPAQVRNVNVAQTDNAQLKSAAPSQAPLFNSLQPQPLQFNTPDLAPQIFYNGAPTNYFNLPEVYSTAKPIIAQHTVSLQQPAFNFAQPAYSLSQSAFNLPQPAFSLPQSTFSFPQPSFSLPQPVVSLHQPLFSARQLNVELSPLSPTTVAPHHFDATPTPLPLTVNTATPAPFHFVHNIVTSTPAPLTFSTVQSAYDGPSHSYLPPDNSIKK